MHQKVNEHILGDFFGKQILKDQNQLDFKEFEFEEEMKEFQSKFEVEQNFTEQQRLENYYQESKDKNIDQSKGKKDEKNYLIFSDQNLEQFAHDGLDHKLTKNNRNLSEKNKGNIQLILLYKRYKRPGHI